MSHCARLGQEIDHEAAWEGREDEALIIVGNALYKRRYGKLTIDLSDLSRDVVLFLDQGHRP